MNNTEQGNKLYQFTKTQIEGLLKEQRELCATLYAYENIHRRQPRTPFSEIILNAPSPDISLYELKEEDVVNERLREAADLNDFVPSSSNTDEAPVVSHSCTVGNSIEQLWETLINAESEKGWWDITFYHKDKGVNISKWGEDQMEMQIEVSMAEWKDLCQLLNRLTTAQ